MIVPHYAPDDLIIGPGTVYRVVSVLGSGGMATVYRAINKSLNSPCAIKVLDRHLTLTRPSLSRRFEEEARATAQLVHPSIIRVLHLARVQDEVGAPFYVMELLNGESLKKGLERRSRFPLETAITLAIDIFFALDTAHERGVIHRDIKPDNVIVHQERDGRVTAKLIDFGVMRIQQDDGLEGFCGTPAYAAPEQLRQEPITTKVDVYAAGVVLHEMLTGRRPYSGAGIDKDGELELITEDAPSLATHGDFPRLLVDVVAAALRLDPAARPDAFRIASDLVKVKRALRGSAKGHDDLVTAENFAEPQEQGVLPITRADVAAPTDLDAALPEWMRALREDAAAFAAPATGRNASAPAASNLAVDGSTVPEPRDLAHARTDPAGPAPRNFRQLPTQTSPRVLAACPPKFDTEPLQSSQPVQGPRSTQAPSLPAVRAPESSGTLFVDEQAPDRDAPSNGRGRDVAPRKPVPAPGRGRPKDVQSFMIRARRAIARPISIRATLFVVGLSSLAGTGALSMLAQKTAPPPHPTEMLVPSVGPPRSAIPPAPVASPVPSLAASVPSKASVAAPAPPRASAPPPGRLHRKPPAPATSPGVQMPASGLDDLKVRIEK